MATTNHSNSNVTGLRVMPDFEHLPHPVLSEVSTVEEAFTQLIEPLTALECIVALLDHLECAQLRADYVKCLLHPHITRLSRVCNEIGERV